MANPLICILNPTTTLIDEVQSISQAPGVAGSPVVLNQSGLIDPSLIGTGTSAVAGQSLSGGRLINLYNVGGVLHMQYAYGDPSGGTAPSGASYPLLAAGFLATGISTGTAPVQFSGTFTYVDPNSEFSSTDINAIVYLSATTPFSANAGGVTKTPPAGGGKLQQAVGVVVGFTSPNLVLVSFSLTPQTTVTFANVGSGTNSVSTMTLGTGGTLTFSGSGIVNASQIQGSPISATPPTSGQALVWNGSAWAGASVVTIAGDIGGTGASPTIISTHLSAPLPVAQGGTGVVTAPPNNFFRGANSGTSSVAPFFGPLVPYDAVSLLSAKSAGSYIMLDSDRGQTIVLDGTPLSLSLPDPATGISVIVRAISETFGGTHSVTFPCMAGSSLLIIGLMELSTTDIFVSPSDTESNIYAITNSIVRAVSPQLGSLQAWTTSAVTASSSNTFSINTGTFQTTKLFAIELVGVTTVDQSNANALGAGTPTAPALTTTNANDLIVAFHNPTKASPPWPGVLQPTSGYSVAFNQYDPTIGFTAELLQTKIVSATGTYAPAITPTGFAASMNLAVAFRRAAAAPAFNSSWSVDVINNNTSTLTPVQVVSQAPINGLVNGVFLNAQGKATFQSDGTQWTTGYNPLTTIVPWDGVTASFVIEGINCPDPINSPTMVLSGVAPGLFLFGNGATITVAGNINGSGIVQSGHFRAPVGVTGNLDAQQTQSGGSWSASTFFASSSVIIADDGSIQQNLGLDGTSGAGPSQPAWNDTPGGTTIDGTITWTCIPFPVGWSVNVDMSVPESLMMSFTNAALMNPFTAQINESGGYTSFQGALVGAQQIVAFSATPVFNAYHGNSFTMTLSGNVTSSTIIKGTTGQQLTFLITQDGTGSRTFAWPSNVKGAGAIDATASNTSSQSFTLHSNGNWYANAAIVLGM